MTIERIGDLLQLQFARLPAARAVRHGMKPKGKMTACYAVGWHFFRSISRFIIAIGCLTLERVPLQGPVILASNHASYIDPPLVGAGVRRQINYLARDSIFRVPVLASILRSWEVVPVDRDGGTGRGLKAILDRLEPRRGDHFVSRKERARGTGN